jgi:predicted transglutaminase-like protease
MKNQILKIAGLNALATTAYIAAVVSFIFYAPKTIDEKATVLLPIMMLLLFVSSAAITGSLVLGRPILWYMDGKKKDAIHLLIATLVSLFAITLVAFCTLLLLTK